MNLPLLKSHQLNIQRNRQTLLEVNDVVLPNSGLYYLTGPLASGKTTLLETLAGLLPYSGSLDFPLLEHRKKAGQYISDMVAYVPQKAVLPAGYVPDLYYQRRYNAAEQEDIPTVAFILNSLCKDKEYLDSICDILFLEDLLAQPFIQLSNGQTRRLLIAIGLLKKPELLLLDNPFIGLDAAARASLYKTFDNILQSGVSIIVSGDSAHVPHHSNAVWILDKNKSLRMEDVATFKAKKQPVFPAFVWKSPFENSLNRNNENAFFCRLRQVKVAYGEKTILPGLNWEVKSGEHWLIKGPNGSGKSTLLGILFGDHPQAYANDVEIMGHQRGNGESIWDIKKPIGFFSPELQRYYQQNISCEEVVGSGLNDFVGLVKPLKADEKAVVEQLLQSLGLSDLSQRAFLKISDGEQRLVMLARAFVKNPPVLILDEPLQGLDEYHQYFLKNWIQRFSEGKTLLYVSHEIHEIPEGVRLTLDLGNA